jgi:hypothetical protein
VGFRAGLVDMTHDEAWSFQIIKHFWYAEFLCTGNSHWLNSAALKISIWLGCENAFCLRWFSVLSFIITCGFGLWWIRSFASNSIKLLGFCLLFLNPYLLDYFGLARGYAGGIMFQCLALILFIKGLEKGKRSFLFTSLSCSALSTISNYSFVYFFMAFGIIYFYTIHFKNKKSFLKDKAFYFDLACCLFVAFIIIRAFIFIIRCSNDVVGAGEPSFFAMFDVFSDGLVYSKLTLSKTTLNFISVLFFVSVAISSIYGIIKKHKHGNLLYFYISLMLSIMVFAMVFNYVFFHVVYPNYRSAQFLFVPVFMSVTYFISYTFSFYKIFKPIIYFICFLLILNFCLSMNFKYTFDYKEQADGKDCFDRVNELHPIRVGISPEIYGLFANYYQLTETKKYDFRGERIQTCRPKGISKNKNELTGFDYLILFPPYDLSYYKNNSVKISAVYLSPITKTLILKIKKP